ncbi:MAG: TRIC cation channel family protein [Caldilineaceae bacterium]
MHKRYDFAGVLTIAPLASTGGSMIRDGIFLQRTPPVLTTVVHPADRHGHGVDRSFSAAHHSDGA